MFIYVISLSLVLASKSIAKYFCPPVALLMTLKASIITRIYMGIISDLKPILEVRLLTVEGD